jgi:hypothetical protein
MSHRCLPPVVSAQNARKSAIVRVSESEKLRDIQRKLALNDHSTGNFETERR